MSAAPRLGRSKSLCILSIDHRIPLLELARAMNLGIDRIEAFKLLVVEATAKVAQGRQGFGMFLDGGAGRKALEAAPRHDLWLARPIDRPHVRPLDFDCDIPVEEELARWPRHHVVKCALYAHPDEDEAFWEPTEKALLRLTKACHTQGLELLLETLSSPHGPVTDDTTARVMQRIYGIGIKPNWWVIEPQPSAHAWSIVGDVLRQNDRNCQGILTIARTIEGFGDIAMQARQESSVRGFCAGRSVFGETLPARLEENLDDMQAVEQMAKRFQALVTAWHMAEHVN